MSGGFTSTKVLALIGGAFVMCAVAVLLLTDRVTRPRLAMAAWAWFAVGLVIEYAALVNQVQMEQELNDG